MRVTIEIAIMMVIIVALLTIAKRMQRRPRQRISLLVPRRSDHGHRDMVWRWLVRYWKHELPGVEVVMGVDWRKDRPFSKAVAVNDAIRKATGDVFVIVDADAYLPGEVIRHCVERIRRARLQGVRLWFVPYHYIYRLTPEATARVLRSNPRHPTRFSSPPSDDDVQDTAGSGAGHLFGAMITILPREAIEWIGGVDAQGRLQGGMDERFRGWGGEDVSFLRAVDTLWARHRNRHGDALHLWHPKIHVGTPSSKNQWITRVWDGQTSARSNDWLASLYNAATGNPDKMRALVDTGLPPRREGRRWGRSDR